MGLVRTPTCCIPMGVPPSAWDPARCSLDIAIPTNHSSLAHTRFSLLISACSSVYQDNSVAPFPCTGRQPLKPYVIYEKRDDATNFSQEQWFWLFFLGVVWRFKRETHGVAGLIRVCYREQARSRWLHRLLKSQSRFLFRCKPCTEALPLVRVH